MACMMLGMPTVPDKTAGQRPMAAASRPVTFDHEHLNEAAVRGPRRLRAALYGRVSNDQNAGASIDEQDVDNTDACLQRDWEVAGRYSDKITASRFGQGKTRADFERLVAEIETGNIDIVVVWEVSRLTRDLEIGARLVKLCRRRRVLIHVTDDRRTYNLRVSADAHDLHKAMADAANESEKTSHRVRRNRKSAAAKGRPHGRIHYGYERVYDSRTRAFLEQREHTVEGPIVRAIIECVAAGIPVSTIAEELDKWGIPAPSGAIWHRSTVRRIAINPAYIGQRLHRHEDDNGDAVSEILEGGWPALVHDVQHHAAVALLADPIRKTTRPGAARHLLSYLATCSVCGAELAVRAIRSSTRVYICSGPRQCAAITVDSLDELVSQTICWRLSDPAIYEAVMSGNDADVLAARAEAAALREQLGEYVAAGLARKLSALRVGEAEAHLTPLIEAAERRASNAAVPGPLRALLDGGPAPYDTLRARFAELDVAQRKAAVRALVTIVVLPAGRVNNVPLDRRRVRVDWISGP